MREIFLQFQESEAGKAQSLRPWSPNEPPSGPLPFELLVTGSQEALFADTPERSPTDVMIDGRLCSRDVPPNAREMLLRILPEPERNEVANTGEPIRLRIVSGIAAIDWIPWELLDGKSSGGGAVGVTRLVPVRLPPPPMSAAPPVRVLLVVTSPKDEQILDSSLEIDAVTSGIDRQQYQIQILERATREQAAATVRSFEPHILHYVGHSGVVRGAGELVLHDAQGGSDWIGAAEIAQLLPISTRLLCLSTCFTRPNYNLRGLPLLAHAPPFVKLPTCVTNRAEVTETQVRTFWTHFYDQLIRRRGNIEDAYFAAQDATAESPRRDAFSLVLRDGGAHAIRIAAAVNPDRFAVEIQARFASRLATELEEKFKSFGGDAKTLRESFTEERNRFVGFANRAASYRDES
jgi:hypothetical protein